uniref:Reverse transcriptase Ty1/copia-type domain-containing protein n=1 Tax=Arundo donax TaxID=35708 RepID=A0A0A9BJK1_ARUDO
MTDLGELHYFLGISVTRSDSGMFLCQKQYAADLLHRVGMSDCHSTTTPVDISPNCPLLLVIRLPIPLSTGVLQALYSTLLSLGQTSAMQFSNLVYTCMIRVSPTLHLLSVFCSMSKGPSVMVCTSMLLLLPS